MMTKEASVTTALRKPTLMFSVCSTNILTSSAMRWSGLSARIALKLHAVVVGVVQPFAEIVLGQPVPPADLEPLIEIELIDGERDIDGRKHAKDADFADEAVPVLLLQRIIEAVVPLVEENVEPDHREFDRDDRRQQQAACEFVFGTEVGSSDAPHGRRPQADIVHRSGSPGE